MKKILLVTGASGGIGTEVVKLASTLGYAVCIHYRSNEEQANALCKELNDKGAQAMSIQADVSSEADVVSMFESITSELGPVSALVNNAGIIAPFSKLESIDAKRIEQLFRVNVSGSFLCAREAVKIMSRNNGGNGGAIVNISSVAASLGSPNEFIDYAATKGAIDTFTVGLAKEVAEEGIRVNAVRPGLIETVMHAHAGDPSRTERLKPFIPMKRAGRSEEIANAILWLLSDSASYVTGTLLDVSGGR